MKDRIIFGLTAGLIAPFIIILLFWLGHFSHLTFKEFFYQATFLQVQFKILAIGVFFADLGIFYLFLHMKRYKTAQGVIGAVFIYFFLFVASKL